MGSSWWSLTHAILNKNAGREGVVGGEERILLKGILLAWLDRRGIVSGHLVDDASRVAALDLNDNLTLARASIVVSQQLRVIEVSGEVSQRVKVRADQFPAAAITRRH